MTILDSLEAAGVAWCSEADFARLIAVARAALEFIYAPNYPKPGQKDERTQRAMAEDRLIVALDSLITSGGMKS